MNNRYKDIARAKAIEEKNKKRWLAINPMLDNKSGIYILTREDEEHFKYCYVGQAKHILSRLASHLRGYQHIDLSLKKHGLYSNDNPYGWKVGFLHFPAAELDEQEQKYIKLYADKGYQLRNKTSGSQGTGKKQIADYKASKGYYDGLSQGRINLAREIKHIIDKHLIVSLKPEKQNNKISIKAFEKFNELLKVGDEHEQGE